MADTPLVADGYIDGKTLIMFLKEDYKNIKFTGASESYKSFTSATESTTDLIAKLDESCNLHQGNNIHTMLML